MLSRLPGKELRTSIGGIFLLLCAYGIPVAGAQEKTIDDYINEARPYLHLSCESAWAASNENGEEYVGMINRFVAILFINHDFDVKRIDEAPAADQEQLKVIFYNEIGKRCNERPQSLLAGVVEDSLVYAFDEMKSKTGKQNSSSEWSVKAGLMCSNSERSDSYLRFGGICQEGPLGEIKVGAYADLIGVDCNPLENLDLVADAQNNFVMIMKDGKIYKNTIQ